jgi:hypothetical protein
MKLLKILSVFVLFSTKIFAQDAILISEGNFVRGEIKGTNFISVALAQEDQTIVEYQAKDIQSFVWNGETYVSKPIVAKKKMEYRFFKVIETGAINLYSYGDKAITPAVAQPKVKIRPSIGLGMGTGGFGGGVGGGISIGGGGRRDDEQVGNTPKGKISYFLEKPGTGPMQEISLDAGKIAGVKALLAQKMNNDEDLVQSINATERFDAKNLAAYVKSYNVGHK